MIKRKTKSLFSQEEIKESAQALKVESNKDMHSSATVQIGERPIICKKCGAEFSSADIVCYECFKHPDRVAVYCPKCTTLNKILKKLTMTEFRRDK